MHLQILAITINPSLIGHDRYYEAGFGAPHAPTRKLSHGAENFQEWTTDGFFRETQDMVRYRGAEGCTTVEMECAALAACARKRGASFGQILYTADSLANIYAHDERDWGKGSLRKALELCIAVLQTI